MKTLLASRMIIPSLTRVLAVLWITCALWALPLPPSTVNASKGAFDNIVLLDWPDAAGAASYDVWRNTQDNYSGATRIGEAEWWYATYMDVTVAPGVLYYYWITTWDGTSRSAPSATVTGYAGSLPNEMFTLAVEAAHGRVNRSPDQATYPKGTQVILTAIPDVGYTFQGWGGDATGSANPLTVQMIADRHITASFQPSTVTHGTLKVIINPSQVVPLGAAWKLSTQSTWRASNETLSDLPFGAYVIEFKAVSGWTAPAPVTITLAAGLPNVTWTVTYEQSSGSYPLTIQALHGQVLKNPDRALYESGSTVLLTAQPDAGYRFTRWSGDASGSANPISITMNGAKSVIANFEPETITGVTATHSAGSYSSPGSLTVHATLQYPGDRTLLSLGWRPVLPGGWTLSGASGNGSPEVQQGEIVFTGSLTSNPVVFAFTISVPANQTGTQSLYDEAEFQLNGMINPATVSATPNPLVGKLIYHLADFRDPLWQIDGTEANRVLSYWRAGEYSINTLGADGYAAGPGSQSGSRHSADYRDPAWRIDGTEVNRVLSYWRAGAYHADPQGLDGYVPGPAPARSHGWTAAGSPAQPLIQQSGPATYNPGAELRVTNTLSYEGTLLSLLWRPHLPAGWTLTTINADGDPELFAGEILWISGTLPPSPIRMILTLNVPANQTGDVALRGEVEYQASGMINPATAFAAPDPMRIAPAGETPVELSIATYAGLTIEGTIGATYQIQFALDLNQPPPWTPLATVTLTQASHLWFDLQAVNANQRRFYRCVRIL